MARLLLKTKEAAVDARELNWGVNSVGRGPENTIIIHHPSISYHHCDFELGMDFLVVRDRGARASWVPPALVTKQDKQALEIDTFSLSTGAEVPPIRCIFLRNLTDTVVTTRLLGCAGRWQIQESIA